ncbi:MAG: DNA repair exonuclease [Rhodospirillales bacterium]|nr:DNA repair exonuclease [Rhodospirillales bacterium]
MKFIHTADIHLDSPLAGLSAAKDAPFARLRDSTRAALRTLVDYALAEAVDFVVIAGDLYDGTWRDYSTGLFLTAQMARLGGAGIPAYVVLGNHDAESKLTRQLQLPANVHIFAADKAQTIRLDACDVALHGRSFPTPALGENIALAYPPPVPGRFNIGLLHTAAGGREAHANYAPCALADLLAKGYDYWALGHVHAREILSKRPHVVFPGNLQGRNIRETGAKGFTVVQVEDGRVVAADHVAADAVRWFRCGVDLAEAADLDDVLDAVGEALASVAANADGRLAVVRLVVDGPTPAHGALVRSRERLVAECQAAGLRAAGEVWIERVCVTTRPPGDLDAAAGRPDAIGALLRAIADMSGDADARSALAADLEQVVSRLPGEVKAAWSDGTGGIAEARLDGAVAAARDLLAGRVLAGDDA